MCLPPPPLPTALAGRLSWGKGSERRKSLSKGSGLFCTINDFVTSFDPSLLLGHSEQHLWAGQSFSFPSHHGDISRNVTECDYLSRHIPGMYTIWRSEAGDTLSFLAQLSRILEVGHICRQDFENLKWKINLFF